MIQQAINALRILSIDQVQAANSGHPGLPLGAAPILFELFAHHLQHEPEHPHWMNRDRFVMSAGHGSALYYSLLHLFGYGITIEDLKNFRKFDSKTPGHPEFGHTFGVEATTGPLGAGIAMGVGMAMAEAHLDKTFEREGTSLVDHFTYVFHGDGCLNEGISAEALSLAGTLKLHKLILLYDSNNITIEGRTTLAFQEDVGKRMESYGFQVLKVENGNDTEAIGRAIKEAKANKEQPSFIEIKTKIGYASPVEDLAKAHGEPLGVEGVKATRKSLGWENEIAFEIESSILAYYRSLQEDLHSNYRSRIQEFEEELEKDEVRKTEYIQYFSDQTRLYQYLESDEYWSMESKKDATRNISGRILNEIARYCPNLFGGSADLAPSTKTYLSNQGDFSSENYQGKNIHFGVREHAMTGIVNGLQLHGGVRPYGATFMVFTDFMKPMLRLGSIMKLAYFMVLTHDSIGVGEDGPTHQPIEQLTMLRAQPNIDVFRPADTIETLAAYYHIFHQSKTPTILSLTRQNVEILEVTSRGALKGGYIVEDEGDFEVVLIASGSELSLVLESAKEAREQGIKVRVVSMPCIDLFLRQPLAYQDEVLPRFQRNRIAVEAGASLSWSPFVGLDGCVIGLDHYGGSGKAEALYETFNLTKSHILKKIIEMCRK